MNVHLHIDRLVLDGLPLEAGEGDALKAAVEAELGRLLASDGLGPGLRAGGAWRSVRGGNVDLAGAETPGAVGRRIGQAMYVGIGSRRPASRGTGR